MSRPVRPPAAPGERLKRGGGWKGRAAGGWAKSAAGEMAVILSLLIVLAVVVFSPIVAGGGFHNDDWAHATTTQFADGGFVGAVRAFDWVFFRPVQAVYWPATYTALG